MESADDMMIIAVRGGIRTGNISKIFGFFTALDVTAATDGTEQRTSDRSSDGGSSITQEIILAYRRPPPTHHAAAAGGSTLKYS